VEEELLVDVLGDQPTGSLLRSEVATDCVSVVGHRYRIGMQEQRDRGHCWMFSPTTLSSCGAISLASSGKICLAYEAGCSRSWDSITVPQGRSPVERASEESERHLWH
jgi:hypothetical protein